MKNLRIGAVQLQILHILWERGRANAREITTALNQDSTSEIAHSTVQTLLRQLESKGAIAHVREDRTFVFYPLVDQNEVAHGEIQRLTERLFSGSPGGLLAYLLRQETISSEELEQIKKLIEEKEAQS